MASERAARATAAKEKKGSLAIVLHGRMGGLASLMLGAPGRALRSFDGALPSVTSAALCAASLQRHVIAPNQHRFEIDVIGHSWSPEVGRTLDSLFATKRAVHERGAPIGGFRCPNASFAHNYCHRTVSHLLGITRAMRLKMAEEVARGMRYDAVFLSRWDVLWQTPLLELHRLHGFNSPRRAGRVWLPRICVPVEPGAFQGSALRSGICGGAPSLWLATQSANECSHQARACQPDMTREARQLYVMDWWLLLGTSSDADRFAEGVSAQFAEHGARVLSRLATNQRGAVAMGHAWFGAQLIWAMNATLFHTGNIGVDFHLGRAWNEIDCLGMAPQCAGRACRGSDIQLRGWQPPHVAATAKEWRALPHKTAFFVDAHLNRSLPPSISLPDPHAQMASSCEERYMLCKRGSKMCVEADASMEHAMDRHNFKALFLGCAERVCAPPADLPKQPWPTSVEPIAHRPPMDSRECAAALMRLYLHVNESATTGAGVGAVAFADWKGGGVAKRRAQHAASEALRARAEGAPEPAALMDSVCLKAWADSRAGLRTPTFAAPKPKNVTRRRRR